MNLKYTPVLNYDGLTIQRRNCPRRDFLWNVNVTTMKSKTVILNETYGDRDRASLDYFTLFSPLL